MTIGVRSTMLDSSASRASMASVGTCMLGPSPVGIELGTLSNLERGEPVVTTSSGSVGAGTGMA
jgi:hypothetical protein